MYSLHALISKEEGKLKLRHIRLASTDRMFDDLPTKHQLEEAARRAREADPSLGQLVAINQTPNIVAVEIDNGKEKEMLWFE